MIIENYHRLYEMTLPLVGVENLVMGITLSILCLAKKYGRLYNRSGLIFLAIAMLAIAVINIVEYAVGIDEWTTNSSLAVVVFAASIELFLCFFAYVSLLDKSFVTCRRIISELTLIVLFTAAPLFVRDTGSVLFRVLFGMALTFYVVKLAVNLFVYRRHLRRAVSRIEDYHSHESSSLLAWINCTFYVTITVGVVSVFAPMGDYRVLIVYNLFVFFAYFYIYVEVIRNIYIFDGSMAPIEQQAANKPQVQASTENELQERVEAESSDADKEPSGSFMNPRRKVIYQEWIDRKGYTDPCVTADNIALLLNTNRTRLSLYLNNELGMNYYEWIAHLRIEDAKKLLIEEPQTPVCDIAVRIGIEDKSNFGRAFRRVTGTSPTRYRNGYFTNQK